MSTWGDQKTKETKDNERYYCANFISSFGAINAMFLSRDAIVVRMVGKITVMVIIVGPPKGGHMILVMPKKGLLSLVTRHKNVLSFVISENGSCI